MSAPFHWASPKESPRVCARVSCSFRGIDGVYEELYTEVKFSRYLHSMSEFQHFEILFWIVATVTTVTAVVKFIAVEIHDLVEFLKKLWQNPKDNK